MSDIKLTWDPDLLAADFSIEANDLETDDGLETAIMVSLFLDARAEDSDVLPDGQTDRRGWWGDEFAEIAGDKIGSRLWLLDRSKNTPETLEKVGAYSREALQWAIEDKVAESIDIAVDGSTNPEQWRAAITVHRPDGTSTTYLFDHTWKAQLARSA